MHNIDDDDNNIIRRSAYPLNTVVHNIIILSTGLTANQLGMRHYNVLLLRISVCREDGRRDGFNRLAACVCVIL